MPSIESILKSAQPGLMLTPTHGIFITAWLADPSSSKPILNALKRLVSDAETGPERRGLVVAVNGALWGRWSGHVPAGAPSAQPLLASSSHFRDTGGDLWLYLKSDSKEGVDALLTAVEQRLGPLLSRMNPWEGLMQSFPAQQGPEDSG